MAKEQARVRIECGRERDGQAHPPPDRHDECRVPEAAAAEGTP